MFNSAAVYEPYLHLIAKLQCLRNVQELLINKDPVLLDNMLVEILQFHRDTGADVRKFVLGFIEEVADIKHVCKNVAGEVGLSCSALSCSAGVAEEAGPVGAPGLGRS